MSGTACARSRHCARRKKAKTMIYPLGGLLLGALFGALRARMRGGKTLDLVQWAAVYALIGGMIGLFVVVFIDRSYQ